MCAVWLAWVYAVPAESTPSLQPNLTKQILGRYRSVQPSRWSISQSAGHRHLRWNAMSFHFNWPRFSDQFHADATELLNAALNKGNKPKIIADRIEVVELSMGTQPPELEIRDIGELTTDQFRGIFRLSYAGDAHIVLKTKVQANPLNHKNTDMDVMGSSRGILAAHQPLVVPMLLRLSHFRLNAYVVLVVSKQKGITLVFKTDPLQNVDVNSTFDSIAVIQKFIQKEIEGQLREMFREDLPAIIHRLSQRWTAGKTEVKAPYLQKGPSTLPREKIYTPASEPAVRPIPRSDVGYGFPSVGLRPTLVPRPLSVSNIPSDRPKFTSGRSVLSRTSIKETTKPPSPVLERASSFPDIENYDPTYGLRPEGLPSKSGYSGFGQLFAGKIKGFADLGDVVEEPQEIDDGTEFEAIEWEEAAVPDYSTQPPSVADDEGIEYETLPAVGGGVITRPRVLHAQSLIGLPSDAISNPPSTARSPRPPPIRRPRPASEINVLHARSLQRLGAEPADPVTAWREQQLRQTPLNPYLPEYGVPGPSRLGRPVTSPSLPTPSYRGSPEKRPMRRSQHLDPEVNPDSRRSSWVSDPHHSTSSSYTRLSQSSGPDPTISTPPSSDIPPAEDEYGSSMKIKERSRRRSLSPSMVQPFDTLRIGSPPKHDDALPNIVLRPSLNTTIYHLSTLSQSNHTLSPYTHSVEHFTVRSGPPRPSPSPDRQQVATPVEKPRPVRAKRRRMIHLGGKGRSTASTPTVPTPEPAPSEFSDDVDHYFKADDDGLRKRFPYQSL